MNNAERLLEGYILDREFWWKPKDRLKLFPILGDEKYIIKNCGTPIAYIISNSYKDIVYDILIVTLENFKSHKSWSRDKKALIEAAHKYNVLVVFIPSIDIGFGESKYTVSNIKSKKKLLNVVNKLLLSDNSSMLINHYDNSLIAVTASQHYIDESLNSYKLSAEYILLIYLNITNIKFDTFGNICSNYAITVPIIKELIENKIAIIEYLEYGEITYNDNDIDYLDATINTKLLTNNYFTMKVKYNKLKGE